MKNFAKFLLCPAIEVDVASLSISTPRPIALLPTSDLCKAGDMLASQIHTVFDIEDADYLVKETTWSWTTIQFMIVPILTVIALLVFIFAALSIARSVRKIAMNSERLLPNPKVAEHSADFAQVTKDQGLND